MATSLALKRTAASNMLNKLLNPTRSSQLVLPSGSRLYNTSAQMTTRGRDEDQDYDRRVGDVRGRGEFVPSIFTDVFDPFSTTKSLSHLMNMVDQLTDNPFLSATRGMTGGARRGWDVKEDENALHLRVDMPGLDKENIKISVEQNTLVIRGEEDRETEEEVAKRRYSSRVDLPTKLYKVDEIKAEMKNGVLKVVVPKVKEEERKDVIQINVE